MCEEAKAGILDFLIANPARAVAPSNPLGET